MPILKFWFYPWVGYFALPSEKASLWVSPTFAKTGRDSPAVNCAHGLVTCSKRQLIPNIGRKMQDKISKHRIVARFFATGKNKKLVLCFIFRFVSCCKENKQ